MKAEILSIGTEILLGDIVNTNAQFLSKKLAELGIELYNQSVVGDNEKRILTAFHEGFKRCDLIITTGGLGPTKDDLTKELAAKYFGKELVLHEESWNYIQEFFKSIGRVVEGDNKKQAYFPKDSIVMANPNGTAPGAIIEGDNNKVIVILPGPPREMKPMFNNYVLPYLSRKTNTTLISKTLRVFGLGEAHMEELVGDLIENQSNPTIAPYAKENDVTLRITAKAKNKKSAESIISPIENEIKKRLGKNIYGEGDTTLEEVVGNLLVDKNLTIASAESCTGGMVAAGLIKYSGISAVFKEGAITYSNEAKVKRLGVNQKTLDKFGAVSAETAKEMAEGIMKVAETNIGISTTGIAGPTGGTVEKPVGLVYVGLCINGKSTVKKLNLRGNREQIRSKATLKALDLLRRVLIEK